MNLFGTKRICGQNNSEPFLNATRPDYTTGECPSGYAKCTDKTSNENTICYDTSIDGEKEKCPITDIRFLPTNDVDDFLNTNTGYQSLNFNDSAYIVWSKDYDSLPITQTRIESEPCMDSLYQSISVGQTLFYPTEYEKMGCVTEKNTNLKYDPRYKWSGMQTNEFNMRDDSNVYAHMQSLPSYFSYGPNNDQLATYLVKGWVRSTIPWSLQCESEGYSREIGYEAASTDLGFYQKNEGFRKIGIAICVIYSVAVCSHIVTLFCL